VLSIMNPTAFCGAARVGIMVADPQEPFPEPGPRPPARRRPGGMSRDERLRRADERQAMREEWRRRDRRWYGVLAIAGLASTAVGIVLVPLLALLWR
jgi:hypothetical protein